MLFIRLILILFIAAGVTSCSTSIPVRGAAKASNSVKIKRGNKGTFKQKFFTKNNKKRNPNKAGFFSIFSLKRKGQFAVSLKQPRYKLADSFVGGRKKYKAQPGDFSVHLISKKKSNRSSKYLPQAKRFQLVSFKKKQDAFVNKPYEPSKEEVLRIGNQLNLFPNGVLPKR